MRMPEIARSVVRRGRPATWREMLPHPKLANELLVQALVVECRRRFVLAAEPDAIGLYIDGFSARTRRLADDDLNQVRQIIRWSMGGIRWGDRWVRPPNLGLAQVLLIDLVGLGHPGQDFVDDLLATAWGRVARLSRLARQPSRQQSSRNHAGERGPASLVGARLRAFARYDYDLLKNLRDSSDADSNLMLTLAFSSVVRRRFASRLNDEEVDLLATSVSSLVRRQHIAAADIRNVVMGELSGDGNPKTEAGVEASIKLWTYSKIVDDLGMYDAELDALLVELEETLERSGHSLESVDFAG